MLKRLKTRLANYLLKNSLNLVTEEGVIELKYTNVTKTKAKIIIGGRELPEGEARELISDVKAIVRMKGLDLIIRSIQAEATYNLINKSTVIDDMVYAKAMLYTVDVLKKRLTALSNLSQS